MKRLNINENVNIAENTFLYLPPAARNLFDKRFLDLQKLFLHGQPVLQGFQHRAPFIPKILFALSLSLCYNHSMLDLNIGRNNLDHAEHKLKSKVYIAKISHAIL
jgi:hypothetical protein